ncbi:hypothetical protein B9Z65_899 [Elsinoe australis]|uniref:Uncharacterized protein n=1 Tax=Elsinoe australis TaxID=40998 RepID=A0A2P8AJY1_9PEZI|nr:hypothetical protein B9Z65_899 [Elsinoe australis]
MKCLRATLYCERSYFGSYLAQMERLLDHCERQEYYHSPSFQDVSFEDWLPSSIVHNLRNKKLPLRSDLAQPLEENSATIINRAKQALYAINQSKFNLARQLSAGSRFGLQTQGLSAQKNLLQLSQENPARIGLHSSSSLNASLPEDPFAPTPNFNPVQPLVYTVPGEHKKTKRPQQRSVQTATTPVENNIPIQTRRSSRLSTKKIDYAEDSTSSVESPVPEAARPTELTSENLTSFTSLDFPDVDENVRSDQASRSYQPFRIENRMSSDSTLSEALDVSTPPGMGSTVASSRKKRRVEVSASPCLRFSTPKGAQTAATEDPSPTKTDASVISVDLGSHIRKQRQKSAGTIACEKPVQATPTGKPIMVDISPQHDKKPARPSEQYDGHDCDQQQLQSLYSSAITRVLEEHRAKQVSTMVPPPSFTRLTTSDARPISRDGRQQDLDISFTDVDQTAAAEMTRNVAPQQLVNLQVDQTAQPPQVDNHCPTNTYQAQQHMSDYNHLTRQNLAYQLSAIRTQQGNPTLVQQMKQDLGQRIHAMRMQQANPNYSQQFLPNYSQQFNASPATYTVPTNQTNYLYAQQSMQHQSYHVPSRVESHTVPDFRVQANQNQGYSTTATYSNQQSQQTFVSQFGPANHGNMSESFNPALLQMQPGVPTQPMYPYYNIHTNANNSGFSSMEHLPFFPDTRE